jgi:hypothetical protein
MAIVYDLTHTSKTCWRIAREKKWLAYSHHSPSPDVEDKIASLEERRKKKEERRKKKVPT